ncbi:hypothetical protein KSP39_PZI007761 [Platanthera zijinensis]|uniref:DUF4283 domain-containing protein n=1 Tax=Platanthera zijinensis TaxID=2320716 RepID=A0AAP0BPP1_9ASPA
MDEELVRQAMGRFEFAIVGKLLGRRLPFQFLLADLNRKWNSFGEFQLIMLSEDCFTCTFQTAAARDSVLMGGPWYVNGYIVGLDMWSKDFSPSSLNGMSSPIWVRLPHLPLIYWDKKNLGRMARMLGEPLWLDSVTSRWERAEYARFCVRADLSQPEYGLEDRLATSIKRSSTKVSLLYASIVEALAIKLISVSCAHQRWCRQNLKMEGALIFQSRLRMLQNCLHRGRKARLRCSPIWLGHKIRATWTVKM